MKKVKIYTYPDKVPAFIPYQIESFKKLKDDYELIIMNNGSSPSLIEEIRDEARKNNLRCEDVIKKDFTHACFSCAYPVQDSLDRFISTDKNCLSVIIDSDMFLMREFSFNEFMEGWDIAGVPQSRDGGYNMIEYIWNGLVIIDNDKAPNLPSLDMGCGTIWKAPCDVGGMSYFYLRANPNVKWRRIPSTSIITNHPETMALFPDHARSIYEFDFDMEIIEGSFCHYRGGSNWNNKSTEHHNRKKDFIRKLVSK